MAPGEPDGAERDLARLVRLFERAEAEILKSIAAALSRNDPDTAAQRRRRLNEIRGVLNALLALAAGGNPEDESGPAWDVVRSAYRAGSERAVQGHDDASDGPFLGIHLDTARALFEALMGRLTDAAQTVGRRVADEFRAATLEEATTAALAGSTRRETSAAIEQNVRARGIKAFRDRRGREWDLARYAEMAARTTAREAHTAGTVNRLAENGLDLVKVSEHAHERDVCSRYEGKVYSISGNHPSYPRLEERPPFHPNCRHVLTPYSERFS